MNVTPLCEDRLFEACLATLSEERRKKALAYRFRKDQALSLGVGLLLDLALSEFGLRERDMTYGYRENGKPFFPEFPGIYFNLSHSGSIAAAVISDREIGCDVEEIKNADLRIADRFFNPSERDVIFSAPTSKEKEKLFFRFWTLKESFMKITGLGMQLPLSSFSISLEEPISVRHSLPQETEYRFRECFDLSGYALSLCCTEDPVCLQYEKVDLNNLIK